MDGILVLVLIGWIISKMSKKNKKPKKTTSVSSVNKEKTAQMKAAHATKLYAELEKRKPKQVEKKTTLLHNAIGEGESSGRIQMEEAFRGSMQVVSNEGECICDPELEHEREQPSEPESVYAGEIGRGPLVDLSARGLLQGVVMSEILIRPSQRINRR